MRPHNKLDHLLSRIQSSPTKALLNIYRGAIKDLAEKNRQLERRIAQLEEQVKP